MNLLRKIYSSYVCDYPKVLAYMWQASEYKKHSYFKWWLRVVDFRLVQKRGTLTPTKAGKLVRILCGETALTYLLLSMLTIWFIKAHILFIILFVLAVLLAYPFVVAIITIIPLMILRSLWLKPKESMKVRSATKLFASHPGIVIAVAGSYGKTTMKELLAHVLSSEKSVAFTEGNKNTLMSIARFSHTLNGNEDIVVVECGEGASGDVTRMTAMIQPDYAIVTGLAPNHLDGYADLDEIAHDFKALLTYVGYNKAFINGDSHELFEKLGTFAKSYTKNGSFDRWPEGQKIAVDHTTFTLEGCEESLKITSGLIGEHNISVLAFVAGFSRLLGCSKKAVEKALSSTKPYEHRMEPRAFHGAWLIDDTYNGSIDGMKAGLALLKDLQTKGRKLYVTPGLVDQGSETEAVHITLGKAIAQSQPDVLYLMRNSVSPIIEASTREAGFKGETKIIDEPLRFYQHLENIVAKGDIVMCQNDWPDSYR